MGIVAKSFLLFNTIKYLKPVQIFNQIAVRLRPKEPFRKYEKRNVKYTEYNLWLDGLDNDPVFLARFEPEKLLDGRLTMLNQTKEFDRWRFDDASHLWNFNLHYLEYLVPLISMWRSSGTERYKKKAEEILESWYSFGSFEPDSNQAYTVSMRIINQLIIAGNITKRQRLYDSIYAQYRFLIKNQERHLLGNHYLENLKAIVICSVVFNEEDVYEVFIKKFLKELREELTDDHLHFELSPMYHKIVLEDLVRVAIVLRQAKKDEAEIIVDYIRGMCTALYSLEYNINRTPLFNDAGDNVAKPTNALLKFCAATFDIKPQMTDFIAGYCKLYDGKITVIEDCGDFAPSYMPGHAHCDCLSFELFYNCSPVFVNSGTFQYQGKYRKHFRATEAHNTVVINGHEQSELWGEHRAGRRIRDISFSRAGQTIVGEYKNYLGERHRRELKLENGTLSVIDKVTGNAESFLHLAPGLQFRNGYIWGNDLKMKVSTVNMGVRVVPSIYSDEFGKLTQIECVVFFLKDDGKEHAYSITIEERSNF